LNVRLNKWRRDYLHKQHKLVMLFEIVVVVSITSVVCFGVPFMFPCRSKDELWQQGGLCNKEIDVLLVEITCKVCIMASCS
jgi:hypothetical protein